MSIGGVIEKIRSDHAPALGVEIGDRDKLADLEGDDAAGDHIVVDRPLALFVRPRTGRPDRYKAPTVNGITRSPFQCLEQWELHVFARSSRPGAGVLEHEEAAREIADGLLVALYDEMRAAQRSLGDNLEGGFMSSPGGSAIQDAALYVVAFSVLRNVERPPRATGRGVIGPATNTFSNA